jgi:hypothetical protein
MITRVSALTPTTPVQIAPETSGALTDYIRAVFPDGAIVGVRPGMPGRTAKCTVRIEDRSRCTVGYIKCLVGTDAGAILDREHRMLEIVPRGLRPEVVERVKVKDWQLLVLRPLAGAPLRARYPAPGALIAFTRSLQTGSVKKVSEHPWFVRLLQASAGAVDLASKLVRRCWPVAIQHGDLAPWNLVRMQTGRLAAFDWEDGCAEGLSLADHAHFVLQLEALIYRHNPAVARRAASEWLLQVDTDLKLPDAEIITRLTAFAGYLREAYSGHLVSDWAQQWRLAVFQGD